MSKRSDPNKLYDQGNGTYYKDTDGNLYNANGYLIHESQWTIEARKQNEFYRQQQMLREQQMWKDAWNKTGGLPRYLTHPFSSSGLHIGSIVKLVIGIYIFFAVVCFVIPFLLNLFGFVSRIFKVIADLAATFIMAWPKTFKCFGLAFKEWNLFKHFGTFWSYSPELFLGLLISVMMIRSAANFNDDTFEAKDFFKCAVPFMLIEILHYLTQNRAIDTTGSFTFTFAQSIVRGFGLGIGICLIVFVGKKIAYKLKS